MKIEKNNSLDNAEADRGFSRPECYKEYNTTTYVNYLFNM